ncbi:uncharacterized protein LOC121849696 [Callorhinchus milii]|uniref:uncharacterized protein LOC121849696 n=1 Tax=Callorhinchus milii TaxID=7868 RepID=UPI001C3F9992|nr:uncharacterized protein LOC121849696 [Callorhinchus milii]
MISYIRDLREIADDIYSIHKPGPRVGVGQSVAGGADNTAACDTDTVTQTYRQERVNDIREQYAKDSREMAECYTKLSRAVRILKQYSKKSETTFPGGAESLTEHLAVFAAVAETMNKQETVTSRAGSAAQTRLPFISSLISRVNDGHYLNRGARADVAKHIHGVAEVMENEVMAYEEVYKHLEGKPSSLSWQTGLMMCRALKHSSLCGGNRKSYKAEVEQRKEDVKDFVTLFPVWRVWMISYIRDLREIADSIYSIHNPGMKVGVGQSVAGGADNTAAFDTDTKPHFLVELRVSLNTWLDLLLWLKQ